MKEINSTIANNLVLLRKSKNYTQSDIATKMQYSTKTISKWETGEIIPNIENLMLLCEIYNVDLNTITKPILENNLGKKKLNYDLSNKLIISLLGILAVWVIATIVFVYANIISQYSAWIVFIWALPFSCIVGLGFNSLWGHKKLGFIIISIFIWSTITAFYLQFLHYNLIAIYFIGIPVQIAVFLWSGLKPKEKINNK